MKRASGAVLLALLLFAWNVWGYDLWAPDEPYFGEGAREMVREGQWLVPHVLGEVTTDKPPLFFWLIALLSLPLGRVTEATARFPSILASIGSLLLVMRLGRRAGGPSTGALAAAVLATSYLFWDKARTAQIDALLCFLVLSAVSAFEAWRGGEMDGRRAGLVFWGAAGLAVLAKGPVGFLLPLGIALVTLAWDRRLGAWKSFAPVAGPLLFLALVLAWIVPTIVFASGEYSIVEAFRRHVLERALHGMHHRQPPWYYLQVLPVQLLPWSPFVPGAIWLSWRQRERPMSRFLLVHALFVVVFFSVWAEKRDLYVLPAYPAVAVLVARLVEEAGAAARRRWVSAPLALLAGTMLLAGPTIAVASRRFEEIPRAPAWLLSACIVVGGAALAVAAVRAGPRTAIWTTAGTFAALYLVTVQFVYPAINDLKSPRAFARDLARVTEARRDRGGTVFGYRLGNVPRAIAFYTDGIYLREVEAPAELASLLDGSGESYVVTGAAELEGWPADLRAGAEVLAEHRLSRTRLTLVRVRGNGVRNRFGDHRETVPDTVSYQEARSRMARSMSSTCGRMKSSSSGA